MSLSENEDRIRFDECVSIAVDPGHNDSELPLRFHLVVHRDIKGTPFAWHSPLDAGAIRCSICEGGARVYLT